MTFGVERGGAFLIEALASPGGGALPPKFSAAQKGADGARTEDLGRQIRAAIDGGKRSFAIADFYMGGHAAGEFTGMFEKIIADYPHIPDLRFEMLWLRERHGYERNTVNAEGTALAHGGLQPEFEIPPALAGKVFQTIEPVQLVLGDDMKIAFDPTSKRPIVIFDDQGKTVQTIEVGALHPLTGKPLNNPREILLALMQGYQFTDQAPPSARLGGQGAANLLAREGVFESLGDAEAFARLDQLDDATGKHRKGEAWAAVELERRLGLKLERAPAGGKGDFLLADTGETVDMMYALEPASKDKVNSHFAQNWNLTGPDKVSEHLKKYDYVVMDFRDLEIANRKLVLDYLQTLSRREKDKIIIIY